MNHYNLISSGILLLHYVLTIYAYLIIAGALLSWFHTDRRLTWIRLIDRVTEPSLSVVRRILPPIAGLDFSPAVVLMIIYFIDRLLLSAPAARPF